MQKFLEFLTGDDTLLELKGLIHLKVKHSWVPPG